MDRTYLHATALRFKVGERIVQVCNPPVASRTLSHCHLQPSHRTSGASRQVVQPPTYGEFFVSSHVQVMASTHPTRCLSLNRCLPSSC